MTSNRHIAKRECDRLDSRFFFCFVSVYSELMLKNLPSLSLYILNQLHPLLHNFNYLKVSSPKKQRSFHFICVTLFCENENENGDIQHHSLSLNHFLVFFPIQ